MKYPGKLFLILTLSMLSGSPLFAQQPSRYAKELELQSGRYPLEELGEALGYALR